MKRYDRVPIDGGYGDPMSAIVELVFTEIRRLEERIKALEDKG